MPKLTWRVSMRFGQTAARASGQGARFCTARSEPPTRCTRLVSRFHTYAVGVSAVARDYMRAVMAQPAWNEWRDAALREPWILPHDEVDWPEVKRES
jgi:glutathione S-transferase